MTNDEPTRYRFARLIARLVTAFNLEASHERTQVYFEALGDLTLEQITLGVDHAIAECKFYPTIAELRELARRKPLQHGMPAQLRLGNLPPHTPRGREMARGLAEIVALVDPAQRLEKLRELAVAYPGVGWEDAVAQAEQQRASA